MKAYKLFKIRKDGTLGSLFIGASKVLPIGIEMQAEKDLLVSENLKRKFTYRPFWHATSLPKADHLKIDAIVKRVWAEVDIKEFTELKRPDYQGGKWFLAERLTIKKILSPESVEIINLLGSNGDE